MEKRIKTYLLIFIGLFCFSIMGTSLQAQMIGPVQTIGNAQTVGPTSMIGPGTGNIKIGPLEVHPYVGATETYNTNIYKSYFGKAAETDWITTLSPGIRLVLPLQRNSLLFDYRADINWFSKFTETNYTSQSAAMAFNFDLAAGISGTISDSFSDAVIPRKGKTVAGVSGVNDTFRDLPYNSNDFNTRIRYRFVDRWAVEGRYNNYDYAYKNSMDDTGSYKRNLYGGSVFYRLTPKTDILLEYNFATVNYKTATSNDNKNHTFYLGFSFDPTAKLSGDLKVGWGQKMYDNPPAGKTSSYSTFASAVDLKYLLADKDILNLIVYRGIMEDLDTNAPLVDTKAYLGFRHIFSWHEKLSFGARVGYWTRNLQSSTTDANGTVKTRDDRMWIGEVGFNYALQRWLTLGLNYSYNDNDSNFITYKYTENKVWFTIVGAF